MRDLIFVSHATPEDNNFALWITLQLAKHGYRVWCDLTNLLGGERFYDNIDEAIGNQAIKFLFVLSETSHDTKRRGPYEELTRAKNVERIENIEDFIIPLSIDNVAHKSKHITLADLNSIPFEEGWAEGLRVLMEKLAKDGVPKNDNFGAQAVSEWWRGYANAEKGVTPESETLFSNWFLIEEFPKIGICRLSRRQPGSRSKPQFRFPAVEMERNQNRWVTFATLDTISQHVGKDWELADYDQYETINFLDGISERENAALSFYVRRNIVSQLLNEAWLQMIQSRGLPTHELANRKRCFYFPTGFCEKEKIHFQTLSGDKSYRAISGKYKELGFWHFGIQTKPLLRVQQAMFGFIVKPHVVFSSDGKNLWTSDKKMHKARRAKCKSWWNSEWRDRILATMSFLADGGETIILPLAPEVYVQVNSRPLPIEVPVSFIDPPPKTQGKLNVPESDEDEVEDFEDDDEWDELENFTVENPPFQGDSNV